MVNCPVHQVEPRPERLLDRRDPVQLRVVRAHHCAVVADQLLARVAEVPQRLLVQEAVALRLVLCLHPLETAVLRERPQRPMESCSAWVERTCKREARLGVSAGLADQVWLALELGLQISPRS